MSKKIIILSIIIEVFIIVMLASRAFRPEEMLNISFDDWILSNDEESGEALSYASPLFYINKGSYAIDIEYNADEDGIIYISAADNSSNLEEYTTTLHSQNKTERIELEATVPVDNVQAIISFNNNNCIIQDIKIYHTRCMEKRFLTIVLLVILIANFIYIFRKYINTHKTTIVCVFIIGLAASIPYFSYGIEVGHDLNFDLARIEGVTEELAAGHFPVRIQSFINYGYGFPLSIFYGDLLLYFSVIFRLLGFNLVQSCKIYVTLINMLTALTSYYAGHRIFKSKNTALLFSAAYTLSTYRFLDIYVRSALGEYTALAFFPLVLVGIFEIYFASDNISLINKRGLICLSCGMIGIITCHILSTQMMCTFLLVFSLIYIKRTIQKPIILTLGLSVGLTALLSAWFIIPFLDYYMSIDIDVHSLEAMASGIQFFGAYLTQYFAVFKSMFGSDDNLIVNRFSITPGLLLMVVLVCALTLIAYKKANRPIKYITASVLFIMFFSSNLFPWDIIGKTKIGNFLARIQFPWRWIGFACLLLAVLLGIIIEYLVENSKVDRHLIYAIPIVLLVVQVGMFYSSYASDALSIRCPKYASDLDAKENRWYIRTGSNYDAYTFDMTGDSLVHSALLKKSGTDYVYSVTTDSQGDVTFPILNYKGEDGEKYAIKIDIDKEGTLTLYINEIYCSSYILENLNEKFDKVIDFKDISEFKNVLEKNISKKTLILKSPYNHVINSVWKFFPKEQANKQTFTLISQKKRKNKNGKLYKIYL